MINSLTDGLNSFWEFEENSGIRYDSHGTRHLTDNATVTSNTGKINTAAEFTRASSEFLSHADHTDFEPGDTDFSFAAWVYPTTGIGNYPTILSKYQTAPGVRSYSLMLGWFEFQMFQFLLSSDGTAQSSVVASNFGVISMSTWYFVVIGYDATANLMSISVNDGTPNTAAQTGGAFNTTHHFRIGYIYETDANRFWNGRIDQVGYWKRKLTIDETAWLYNGGDGRSYEEMYQAPLSVRKLIARRAAAAPGGFQAAWARGANTVLGVRGGP